MRVITSDVLVIGAGLAGERAAIACAKEELDVILLSLVPPRRSHSSAAQGGMQAEGIRFCIKSNWKKTSPKRNHTVWSLSTYDGNGSKNIT